MKLITILVFVGVLFSGLMAQQDVTVFQTDNKDGKITTKTIEKAFAKAGFHISVNRDMNGPFKKQFKTSDFDVYNLFTFYKKDTVLALAKKYENVGLFAPMSMAIYTKKGDSSISVASLSAEAMAKIMNIKGEEKILTDLRALIVKTLKTAMPNGKFKKLGYSIQKPKGALVTKYTMDMDADEWEEEFEDIEMDFEGQLVSNGFIIAGQSNLNDDFEEVDYEGYDVYKVYSICKLPVIYNIAKTRPEAGAFAPCSLYFNKKHDEEKMTVAFPSVYNWMSSLGMDNKEDMAVLEDAQKKINGILTAITE
jgi:uncharacterized protein (DUF302 family)